MIVIDSVNDLQARLAELRRLGTRIAFVPTMGNLHAGHLRLVQVARKNADFVVCSIFVNPLQFGKDEDLHAYPRTPDEDSALLEAENTDLLFIPSVKAVYPRGLQAQTFVEVPGISDELCGAVRPGHFRGVTTVVNRLFNLVQPDLAIFGKKDYQQLVIIGLMVKDLAMPIEIGGIDTIREDDGLAMSSRNRYLSREERIKAPSLYTALSAARQQMQASGHYSAGIEKDTAAVLTATGFKLDYVSVRRQQDFEKPAKTDKKLVILAAAWLGKARLIDNIEVDLTQTESGARK